MNRNKIALTLAGALAAVALPRTAGAFCGFYVAGSGSQLYNNATQVVLMRDGTRTVLSMQNNYQGPPEDFALVIPVPVVLQKADVKTLPKEIFDRVDKLDSPRLVEYWEQDPCAPIHPMRHYAGSKRTRASSAPRPPAKPADLGVTIEAKFTVGEYKILILSAKESTGLETWLHQEGYKIPRGAAAYLRPYVQGGSKFFVAKVDIKKVKMSGGMAALSPLRFHYDTPDFALPIRLGLMNAKDKQDLIVHILARGKRYELANFPNVFIPTNLDVKDAARGRFAEFYAALFDATMEKNPGAVVTEYSWNANSCDPCPTPALSQSELMTLGLDVLSNAIAVPPPGKRGGRPAPRRRRRPPPRPYAYGGWVLTRLHARYGAGDVHDDLVFRQAKPVMGGREVRTGKDSTLAQGATPAGMNNFQARYAIRHEWTGPIECANPVRDRWGGPPSGTPAQQVKPATGLAFAPRGKAKLASWVARDVPELKVVAAPTAPTEAPAKPDETTPTPTETSPATPLEPPPGQPPKPETKASKKGCAAGGGTGAGAVLLLLGLAVVSRRRRRR